MSFSAVAVTVAADLFEIVPAANVPIVILGFRIEQQNRFGDANEDVIPVAWVRGNTTTGSGGTAASAGTTLVAKDGRDGAATFTAATCNTTPATAGTAATCYNGGWNVRGPMYEVFTEDQQIRCDAGQNRICLRLGKAPGASTTISGSVDVKEL
ncbi:MAG TPA: hypothetical protein VFD36_00450 [Kofleriaceae bacterium]|nr:hypothetical protein [Kofleriaceae bacterium]